MNFSLSLTHSPKREVIAKLKQGYRFFGSLGHTFQDSVGAASHWALCFCGVASLCKEMNLQGKANGRKVVVFGKLRNLQGTENPRKEKLESARKGNCKEWNLQVKVTFNVNCMSVNVQIVKCSSY